MSRMRRGWALTGQSWRLLRSNKELFRFPIVGILVTVLALIVFVGPGLYLLEQDKAIPVAIVLMVIGFYSAAYLTVFYGVGLAASADELFRTGQTSYDAGIAVARTRRGSIASWALISTIVGFLIQALSSIRGIGPILASLVGLAWGLITFLAIPVIAIEGKTGFNVVKRSTELFKSRWQGQVAGNIAIGGIIGLLGILPAMIAIGLGIYIWTGDSGGDSVALAAALIGIGAIVLAVASLLIHAMRGVFGVALYRYASDDAVAPGFSREDLESAVRTKG